MDWVGDDERGGVHSRKLQQVCFEVLLFFPSVWQNCRCSNKRSDLLGCKSGSRKAGWLLPLLFLFSLVLQAPNDYQACTSTFFG